MYVLMMLLIASGLFLMVLESLFQGNPKLSKTELSISMIVSIICMFEGFFVYFLMTGT